MSVFEIIGVVTSITIGLLGLSAMLFLVVDHARVFLRERRKFYNSKDYNTRKELIKLRGEIDRKLAKLGDDE